jgi:hypothetical protein
MSMLKETNQSPTMYIHQRRIEAETIWPMVLVLNWWVESDEPLLRSR